MLVSCTLSSHRIAEQSELTLSRRSHVEAVPSLGCRFADFPSRVKSFHDRRFDPDWARTLAVSLSRPETPSMEEINALDLVASEDLETAFFVLVEGGSSVADAQQLVRDARVSFLEVPLAR